MDWPSTDVANIKGLWRERYISCKIIVTRYRQFHVNSRIHWQNSSSFASYDQIYWLNYSIVQSSCWEANISSASHKISQILRNPKVHYRIHNNPPHVPIISQTDPGQCSQTNYQRSILILFSHLCLHLPSDLLPSGFPTKIVYIPLLSPIRATYPAQNVRLMDGKGFERKNSHPIRGDRGNSQKNLDVQGLGRDFNQIQC